MNRPYFSIIIPAFNARETLEDCLESVWEQTNSDYEIILCDDGSTDGSGDFFKAWAESKVGLRYTLIEQENKGLGASRNAAINSAQGEYCALLDADDLWHPEKLESCKSYLASMPDTVVLYHQVENFGLNQSYERRTFPVKGLEDLIEQGCPLVPSATLIRTDMARAHPFQSDRSFHGAEDIYLWLELLLSGEELTYWPEALSYYREDGGMSSEIGEHLQKVISVYDHFYKSNQINKQSYEKATRRKYYEAARFYHKRGNHHKAHHYYSVADSKSLKILGLRILNALGFNF